MDKTQAESKTTKPRLHGRLFSLGIGFWILVWIASIAGEQSYLLNFKGYRGLEVEINRGALNFVLSNYSVGQTTIRASEFKPISSTFLKEIRRDPGVIVAKLARGGWKRAENGSTTVSFPVAALLWLWLAAGLLAALKFQQFAKDAGHSDVIPVIRRRLIKLTAALIALCLATTFLVMRGRQVDDAATCLVNLRKIDKSVRDYCAVWSLWTGAQLRWNEIDNLPYNRTGKVLKCPCGEDYQLSPVVPPAGKSSASCPHPGHQSVVTPIGR